MTEKNDKQVFGRFLRTKNDQKNRPRDPTIFAEKMNQDILNTINTLLSEWDPIGLPKDIAEDEYMCYAQTIVHKLENNNSVRDYLITILIDLSNSEEIIHNKKAIDDINSLVIKIKQVYRELQNQTKRGQV